MVKSKKFRITRRKNTRHTQKYKMKGGAKTAEIQLFIDGVQVEPIKIPASVIRAQRKKELYDTFSLYTGAPTVPAPAVPAPAPIIQVNDGFDGERLREFISQVLLKEKFIYDSSWVKLLTTEEGSYAGLIIDATRDVVPLGGKDITSYIKILNDDGDIHLEWPLTGLEYLFLRTKDSVKKTVFNLV